MRLDIRFGTGGIGSWRTRARGIAIFPNKVRKEERVKEKDLAFRYPIQNGRDWILEDKGTRYYHIPE